MRLGRPRKAQGNWCTDPNGIEIRALAPLHVVHSGCQTRFGASQSRFWCSPGRALGDRKPYLSAIVYFPRKSTGLKGRRAKPEPAGAWFPWRRPTVIVMWWRRASREIDGASLR